MITAKKLLLPSAISCAMAGVSLPGLAQDDAPDEQQTGMLEEIVVTGVRRGLMDSIALKRESSSIVEAISAEDIGKLPGTSIADSLSRLPGITTQRINGRPSVVSIRGFGPDFSATTLNGREQVSTNDNRGVEFDQYPQELLTSVQVFKTPNATMHAQGLAGTVNMDTISPLKHGERTLSVNARYEFNDTDLDMAGATDDGHRLTGTYIDQFMDDTVGVALGVTDMSNPIQEERFNSWGFQENDDGITVPNGFKPFVNGSDRDRLSFLGVLEWSPNDRFTTTFDAFYSDFEEENTLRGIEFPGASGNSSPNLTTGSPNEIASVEVFTAENGIVRTGRMNGVRGVMRNDIDLIDAEIVSVGSNTTFNITDTWSVEADLSYSEADRTAFSLEVLTGTARGAGFGQADDINFTMDSKGASFEPIRVDYSDLNLIKLGGPLDWGSADIGRSQDGFVNDASIEDEIAAIDLKLKKDLSNNWISDFVVGVNLKNRTKERDDNARFLVLNEAVESNARFIDIPEEFLLNATQLDFLGLGPMVSIDSEALFKSGIYTEVDAPSVQSFRTDNIWEVEEDVITGFAMANLDADIGRNIVLKGNFGLQVVNTDQTSEGSGVEVVDDGSGTVNTVPLSGGASYTEYLPSINLVFDIGQSHQVRAAAAQTLSRARMDDMRASRSISFNDQNATNTDLAQSPWSGGGGNPELRPIEVNQFDLSYSYFFGESNYLSAAIFYKDIRNFVFDTQVLADFSAFTPPVEDPDIVELDQGFVTAPDNIEPGWARGAEVSGHLTGDLIAPFLSDFGVVFSGAYTSSSITPPGDTVSIELLGQSREVYSAELFYARQGFEARINYRYRSSFLGEVTGLSLLREERNIRSEEIVDAQINYDFAGSGISYLDGLTLTAQVTNLTNEPTQTIQDGDNQLVRDFKRFGRNYLVGFSYKF